MTLTHDELRAQLAGIETGYPYIAAPTHTTSKGTSYLTRPGVHLLAKPDVSLESLRPFLEGFAPALDFPQYLDDTPIPFAGAQICKVAGQLCYMSFSAR